LAVTGRTPVRKDALAKGIELSMNTYRYKFVDRCPIHADVYPAPDRWGSGGQFGGRLPALVFLHGGALIWGSRKDIIAQHVDLYRRAGFCVISLDYRLAPETKLPQIVTDVEDGLRWVRESGPDLMGIDPARIALVGSSAGAYLALIAGTMPWRPRAIVSFYGYGDVLAEWYGRPSEHYLSLGEVKEADARATVGDQEISEGERSRMPFYIYCRQRGIWTKEVSGNDIKGQADLLRPYCPAHNVDTGFPPVLLLHGDRDTDVPHTQSIQMADTLGARGIVHKLHTMEGFGHAFDWDMQDPRVRVALDVVIDFLNAHA
jgi:acetyl esterase/lipase